MQSGDFDAHLRAQPGVEIGQRLVEQENLRLAHDGAADGDALPLAPGQFLRPAVKQILELQYAGSLGNLAVDLGPGDAEHLQGEAHVFGNRHVRIERVGLEHHGDAAVGDKQRDVAHGLDLAEALDDVLQFDRCHCFNPCA